MVRMMVLAAVAGLGLLVPTAAADEKNETIRLEGTVTNMTVGKSAGVKIQILFVDGRMRAIGAFDNKNLYGKFDLPGQVVSKADESISLQFAGDLELGDDGSNFPKGTKVRIVMTLSVTDG